MQEALGRRREEVLGRVAAACRRAGRAADEVSVVAVTKSVSAETTAALCRAGCLDLGEARVEVLERKRPALDVLGLTPRWHFIGHLQRNKARRVVKLADVIHSIDTPRLLEAVGRIAREEARRPRVFLQVKLTDEASKSGLAVAELPALLSAARPLREHVQLEGLMTMAPLTEGDDRHEAARATFEQLFRLAAELSAAVPTDTFVSGRPRLSMGMTGDFEQAVAAGADVLRIGSAFFEGLSLPDADPLRRSG